MKKRTPISKIMSSNVVSVNVTDNLRTVKNLIDENGIHHVPVVSGDSVIGMISSTDIARISFVADANSSQVSTAMYDVLSIEQVMAKNIINVQHTDTIKDVTKVFVDHNFHSLPVVDGNKLVGIVTTTDVLKYLHDNY